MKDYVKKYKGHDVPDGATHYNSANMLWPECFINENSGEIYKLDGPEIWVLSQRTMPTTAIPLPEETKAEWMPEVGEEFEFNYGHCHVKNYWQKSKLVAITSRFFIYTQDDIDDEEVDMIDSVIFRPIKTAEEKKREAFIEGVKKLFPKSDTDDLILAGKLFDAGYMAPGEGE